MHRRDAIKVAGITLFLPALESFGQVAPDVVEKKAKRLFCFHVGLGIDSDQFPSGENSEIELSETLKPFEANQEHMTLYTGMHYLGHHPKQHLAFRGSGTSLDQLVADQVGHHTRVRNVTAQIGSGQGVGAASWKNNIPVAPLKSPEAMFKMLFAKVDRAKEQELLAFKKSLLDNSLQEAKSLMNKVSQSDKAKLEEYFAALRESEKELQKSHQWLDEPQPEVDYPKEGNNFEQAFNVIHLAFKFDVTRVFNLYVSSYSVAHHGATHKTQNGRLAKMDKDFYSYVSGLFTKLSKTKTDSGATLMDETLSVFTTGNSSCKKYGPHNGMAVPVIVAGGNLSNHGKHIARPKQSPCDIHLAVLQKLGVEVGSFDNSTRAVEL